MNENDLIINPKNVSNTLLDILEHALLATDKSSEIERSVSEAQFAVNVVLNLVDDLIPFNQRLWFTDLRCRMKFIVEQLPFLKDSYETIVEVFGKPDEWWISLDKEPGTDAHSWQYFEKTFNEIQERRKTDGQDERLPIFQIV